MSNESYNPRSPSVTTCDNSEGKDPVRLFFTTGAKVYKEIRLQLNGTLYVFKLQRAKFGALLLTYKGLATLSMLHDMQSSSPSRCDRFGRLRKAVDAKKKSPDSGDFTSVTVEGFSSHSDGKCLLTVMVGNQ